MDDVFSTDLFCWHSDEMSLTFLHTTSWWDLRVWLSVPPEHSCMQSLAKLLAPKHLKQIMSHLLMSREVTSVSVHAHCTYVITD